MSLKRFILRIKKDKPHFLLPLKDTAVVLLRSTQPTMQRSPIQICYRTSTELTKWTNVAIQNIQILLACFVYWISQLLFLVKCFNVGQILHTGVCSLFLFSVQFWSLSKQTFAYHDSSAQDVTDLQKPQYMNGFLKSNILLSNQGAFQQNESLSELQIPFLWLSCCHYWRVSWPVLSKSMEASVKICYWVVVCWQKWLCSMFSCRKQIFSICFAWVGVGGRLGQLWGWCHWRPCTTLWLSSLPPPPPRPMTTNRLQLANTMR